ncbi:hypothetical protein [Nocardia farcinica]|uniref:hypothetical protein n=1 Tax=Nocardia farcinica TaxID=37329 RepID=UPI0018958371|nr:hypothetical protein [Nocardia farcinica]MBF6187970.1 hypothetical protein [Nocardia farcinica]
MMDLAELRAMWEADDEAKMQAARSDGPRGWMVDAEGTVSVLLDLGGDCIAVPVDRPASTPQDVDATSAPQTTNPPAR